MKNKIAKILICLTLVMTFAFAGIVLAACNDNSGYKDVNRTKNPTPITPATSFLGKTTTHYDVDGKDVTVELFYRDNNEWANNPNVGQALMLSRAIRYKDAHPEEDVYASITSFHFSIVAAVCLDTTSPYYGYVRSLFDSDTDTDGFVRISHLIVEAAKKGIYITAIGQIDASPVMHNGKMTDDIPFDEYFESRMQEDAYVAGKKVSDYLSFKKAKWTSYGDKAASDMMHVKSCYVSKFKDENGVEHGSAIWFGSVNLDAIHDNGSNGNDGTQSALIISDHDKMGIALYNYVRLMYQYCGQEEIAQFRDLINTRNTTQLNLIAEGRGDEISDSQRIVYIGGENDKVFELYFAPFGGSVSTWDTQNNPFCKYVEKIKPYNADGGAITFAWNNVKYLTNFEYSQLLSKAINDAFTGNKRITNKVYLHLPGYDISTLNALEKGLDVGFKKLNANLDKYFHTKDMQMSYIDKEDGLRHYVSLFNSLNFHQGAMSYQTNFCLVINETKYTGNDVYVNYGILTTDGCITENDRVEKRTN